MAALPPLWRILNAFPIAWKYVALLIYPATLSCDYSYNAIPLYVSPWRMLPALLAAVLVFAAWLWALYKRKIAWTLAGAIYFAGFATTANILVATGSVMGERLAYFPSAGFCLLLALLGVRLETRRREFAWSLLILIVVALGARAVVRNFDWRSNLTLFSAAVHAVPGSSKMHGNLGAVYAAMGQFELARSEMQTALRIYPNLPGTVASYGVLESQLGNAQEALRYLRKAVSLTDRTDIEYDFRVVTLAAQLMKLGENDEALRILNDEVAASPTYARAWSNRAVIRYQRGELASARADAETALRLDPSNAQAQHLLSALNNNAAVPPHT
jgi:tetratricopeptide (TPR) repeat protein